jgi:hypothetical protein
LAAKASKVEISSALYLGDRFYSLICLRAATSNALAARRFGANNPPILQASTLNELNHNHDERNDQKHMNESTQGVRGD